ncbi:hypothetical protein GCM10023205_73940 [Yinghuangia aomiensis]|uniref:Uncharacterized protein n=1 Tax=Yinghuangia aomiensis TaxID=676205 RepID=A0ABP9IAB3_9ACTN
MVKNKDAKRAAQISDKRERRAADATKLPQGGGSPVPRREAASGGQQGARRRPSRPAAANRQPEQTDGSSPCAASDTDVAFSAVNELTDASALFRKLSVQLGPRVEKAAVKAGTTAAQQLQSKLVQELDEAISQAMSTAGQLGSLVQRHVQAAIDDALRTAVLQATRVYEQHLAQLVLIDRTVSQARDLTTVRARVDAELRRAGVQRIETWDDLTLFDIAADPGSEGMSAEPAGYRLVAPAYVESATGRVVQRGKLMPAGGAEASVRPASAADKTGTQDRVGRVGAGHVAAPTLEEGR